MRAHEQVQQQPVWLLFKSKALEERYKLWCAAKRWKVRPLACLAPLPLHEQIYSIGEPGVLDNRSPPPQSVHVYAGLPHDVVMFCAQLPYEHQ